VDASFQSAPNERNSPHYDYDHRIWDRVFHAAIPTHWLRPVSNSSQDSAIRNAGP
jgi:hypothetical protein